MKLNTAFPSGPVPMEAQTIGEQDGIRFFVHEIIEPVRNLGAGYRAAEYRTGCGIPGTDATTVAEAQRKARAVIATHGTARFEKAMAKFPTLNQ